MLQERFRCDSSVSFLDTNNPQRWLSRVLLRRFGMLLVLVWRCLRLRGGTVVYFSSAFNSFWEKSSWIMLARICGARPILVMIAGNFPQFFDSLSPWKQKLARRVAALAFAIGVQSPSWKEYYESVFPGVRTVLIRGSVDTDFFSPGATPPAGTRVARVLYVGWIIDDKGIQDLLQAALILKRDGIPFTLRLVGPAFGREDRLVHQIRACGLERTVEYAGVAGSREALRNEYRSADIFALASHFEGFPVALLEAFACGLACVATRVGGCVDIMDNGRVGLLVEPRAPVQLADALRRLVIDHQLRAQVAREARQRAVLEYSIARSMESYCELVGLPSNAKQQETGALAPV